MEKDREEFEKWKKDHSMNLEITIRDSNGDYQYIETRRDWYVWQNAIAKRQAEVEKLKAGNELNLAANRGLGRLVDELQAENERLRKALPSTPEAVIAFIGNNFCSMEPLDEVGNLLGDLSEVIYSLTVHDLISAFSTLFDEEFKEGK